MKSMAEDEVEGIKHEIDNMKLAVCLILINQIRFSPNLKQFTTFSGCHEQTLCDKKFVTDLRQVGGFLWVAPIFSTNKTDCHEIQMYC
jgi:hypothetical protein